MQIDTASGKFMILAIGLAVISVLLGVIASLKPDRKPDWWDDNEDG
jgi:hypothetical protein